jgi:CBS domain-containing protein
VLVGEIMQAAPTPVTNDTSLAEAARLLASSNATDLYLVDDAGKLIGVLTEGDVIRAILPDLAEIHRAWRPVVRAVRAHDAGACGRDAACAAARDPRARTRAV